jgi:putative peptidoglycan lipid II flippase
MFQKIKTLFSKINKESQTITSAAIIIGGLSLVSRILGVVRDRILASSFGAGDTLDVYYAAFRLPDTIYNLLVLGVISAGLIPVFSGLLAKGGKKEAFVLTSRVLNIVLILVVFFCGVLYIFAPQVISFITPGFPPEKTEMVVRLSRVMFLSPIFLAISAVFSSILQSLKKFLIYALAPLFYNFGIIFGAMFLVPRMGIIGLAWGVVIGAFFHMLIQAMPLKGAGWRWKPELGLKDKHVKEVGALMVPRTLSLGVAQINFFILTLFASMMAGGSLAVYNFSYNLQNFPLGVFGVSLGVAALPILSEFAAKGKKKEFAQTFSGTLRQTLFFIIPVASLTYVFRAQIVRLILGAGLFNWYDTRLTAGCLAIFCVALFAQGAYPLVIRAFYALKDTKTPLIAGVATVIVNLVGIVVLSKILATENFFSYYLTVILRLTDLWGYADFRVLALPLALGSSAIFELIVLIILLRIKSGPIQGRKIWASFWRIVIASLGSGVTAYLTLLATSQSIETNTVLGLLLQTGIASVFALVAYVGLGYLLNVEEMYLFAKAFKRKLFREAKVYAEDSISESD